jgi:hypothetical protein
MATFLNNFKNGKRVAEIGRKKIQKLVGNNNIELW